MATIASVITMVGYELQMTVGASTTPSTTEVTQWIKDAQRAMIVDLKSAYLGECMKTEEIAMTTPWTSVTPTDQTVLELESAMLYDNTDSSYTPCRILEYSPFYTLSKSGKNAEAYTYISSFNPEDAKVYVYPAGTENTDKLAISYRQDLDISDTDYRLHTMTIPAAVQYACFLAALQSEDMVQMAMKFYTAYNELVKDFRRK